MPIVPMPCTGAVPEVQAVWGEMPKRPWHLVYLGGGSPEEVRAVQDERGTPAGALYKFESPEKAFKWWERRRRGWLRAKIEQNYARIRAHEAYESQMYARAEDCNRDRLENMSKAYLIEYVEKLEQDARDKDREEAERSKEAFDVALAFDELKELTRAHIAALKDAGGKLHDYDADKFWDCWNAIVFDAHKELA